MAKRLTQEDFIQRSTKVWKDRWNYDKTTFVNSQTKVVLTCKLHGDFTQLPQAHLKGLNGCNICNKQKPIGTEEFIERAVKKYGENRFDYSEVALKEGGIHQKTTIICVVHDLPFTSTAWSFLQGRIGCNKCNKRSSITEEKLKEKARKVFPNKEYDYSKVNYSLGVKKPVSIGCPIKEHGFFEQTLDGHLSGREGCKKCDNENRLMTVEQFIEKSKKVWGREKYEYKDVFLTRDEENARPKITLECPKHGKFTYEMNRHLNGNEGCKECRKSFGPSKGEKDLRNFIECLGVEVIANDRKVLEGKEIDIFVPSLKIGFEYNGLYYHSEKFVGKDSHYQKFLLAEENGVRLYQIWEDDWLKRQEVVKQHIAYLLKKSDKKRIFARDTTVKTVPSQDARTFLNSNHIQGYTPASLYFGLYFGEILVAVASFLKVKEGYVLSRYATSEIIVGGHSKLVSFFEKNITNYEELVTFADLTFSDGNLYKKTNWTEDKLLPPDYCYFYGGERKHKFGFRKKRFKADPELFFEEGLTEKQLAELNDIPRIWDAGKIRFVRRRKL